MFEKLNARIRSWLYPTPPNDPPNHPDPWPSELMSPIEWLTQEEKDRKEIERAAHEARVKATRDHVYSQTIQDLEASAQSDPPEFGKARTYPTATNPDLNIESKPKVDVIAERAARRQAIVQPALEKKSWTRGRLVTKSGVGSGTVYEYLDGTREWISFANGKAIADALGLVVTALPDVQPAD
jgi:hypothetical protein